MIARDLLLRATWAVLLSALASCADARQGMRRLLQGAPGLPDSLPKLTVDSLPFRYPPGLYISQIQGDVTLRLHVNEFGRPEPESTRVEVHSQYAAFDSSAMAGAKLLLFRPALREGRPIPYTILFPIKFRVPNGPPMPSDTSAEAK
jgi:TonB family protein